MIPKFKQFIKMAKGKNTVFEQLFGCYVDVAVNLCIVTVSVHTDVKNSFYVTEDALLCLVSIDRVKVNSDYLKRK